MPKSKVKPKRRPEPPKPRIGTPEQLENLLRRHFPQFPGKSKPKTKGKTRDA